MQSTPLLERPVSFLVHAIWCPHGSWRDSRSTILTESPNLRSGWETPVCACDGLGCRATISSHAASGKMSCREAATPRTPDQREGSFPGPLPPGPFFKIPWHDEDTRSPVYLDTFSHLFFPTWTLYSLFGHFYVWFMLINASPRSDATLAVSVVCSSRHNTYGDLGLK